MALPDGGDDVSELEELAARVARLEERLDMESGLSASRDRDLSDLAVTVNAIKGTVQAVHLNQADHGVKLDRLREAVEGHTVQLGHLEAGVQTIVGMLTTLIERRDE